MCLGTARSEQIEEIKSKSVFSGAWEGKGGPRKMRLQLFPSVAPHFSPRLRRPFLQNLNWDLVQERQMFPDEARFWESGSWLAPVGSEGWRDEGGTGSERGGSVISSQGSPLILTVTGEATETRHYPPSCPTPYH